MESDLELTLGHSMGEVEPKSGLFWVRSFNFLDISVNMGTRRQEVGGVGISILKLLWVLLLVLPSGVRVLGVGGPASIITYSLTRLVLNTLNNSWLMSRIRH